jgi:hypothetical protein
MPAPQKAIVVLETSAACNQKKDTKNFFLSYPLPDKDEGGKGIVFINNDGQVYLSKKRLAKLGIKEPHEIKNFHVKIWIEKE